MKKISIVLAFVLILTVFSACKKGNDGENSTTGFSESPITSAYQEETMPQQETTQPLTDAPTQAQTVTQAQTPQTQAQTQVTTEQSKTVTYISENPNNKYIVMVADKYGSDKANLIAFIKTNSSTPGATVLEFSGAKDANGKLLTTDEELRFVYDVPDSGTIKRASSDGLHNDGYNSMTAKVAIELGKKFFIPSIEEMRTQRRYEDYF